MNSATTSLLISGLLPVVIPLVIAAVKKMIPNIPRAWLPIIAPLLGAGLDIANYYATGTSLGAQWGAALGAAGVGVREIYDQMRGTIAPKVP